MRTDSVGYVSALSIEQHFPTGVEGTVDWLNAASVEQAARPELRRCLILSMRGRGGHDPRPGRRPSLRLAAKRALASVLSKRRLVCSSER